MNPNDTVLVAAAQGLGGASVLAAFGYWVLGPRLGPSKGLGVAGLLAGLGSVLLASRAPKAATWMLGGALAVLAAGVVYEPVRVWVSARYLENELWRARQALPGGFEATVGGQTVRFQLTGPGPALGIAALDADSLEQGAAAPCQDGCHPTRAPTSGG